MVETVLQQFNLPANCQNSFLGGAGGFSGAEIWRVNAPLRGDLCLKRWPRQFQDQERLEWIHKVLIFARANGCPELVQPIQSSTGATFVYAHETYWDLSPWAQGESLTPESINADQINSAVETLARFHQATARYFFNFARSPKMASVREQLLNVQNTIDVIKPHVSEFSWLKTDQWMNFATHAPAIAMDVARFLLTHTATMFPVQPIISDIRSEHLFFTGDKVSAIIDFGAMKIDSVACDLSRLFGSLFADDPNRFQAALKNYSSHRQLSASEYDVVLPLSHAGVILGLTNWLIWLLVEKRQFDEPAHAHARVQHLLQRFQNFT